MAEAAKNKMWAIYKKPKDYPEAFVVREWILENGQHKPGQVLAIGPSLEIMRDAIPDGTVRVGRLPDEDPCIVEAWI